MLTAIMASTVIAQPVDNLDDFFSPQGATVTSAS